MRVVGIPLVCIGFMTAVLLFVVGGADLLRFALIQLLTPRGVERAALAIGGLILITWLRHLAWYQDEQPPMWFRRSMWLNVVEALALLAIITLGIWAIPRFAAAGPQQKFTLYPPSVYMQFFSPCSAGQLCARTDDFHVDLVPKGCCILVVTNGNGQGKDEVQSYEVLLNGKTVLPSSRSPNAQANITLQTSNSIKVVLTGEPTSKVFLLITYDPRQAK